MTPDEKFALDMARFYRARGFNVIPSSPTEKKPMYAFVDRYGWDTKFPAEWFDDAAWEANPTTNLQVVLGSAWKLLVVDLDGPGAKKVWDRWVAEKGCRRTWAVHREGGDSHHLWFKVPRWWDGPVKKRIAWKEDGVKHSAVEVLGDRSLITAPPSRHVKTGGMYRFLKGHTPWDRGLGHPAEAPGWVMNLPAIAPERPKVEFVAKRPSKPLPALDRDSLPDRNQVLDMVHDKAAFARTHWGVRLTGRVTGTGWAECHAIGRDDDNPSAAIHRDLGVYKDQGTGLVLPFFDIPIHMGYASDFPEALSDVYRRVR